MPYQWGAKSAQASFTIIRLTFRGQAFHSISNRTFHYYTLNGHMYSVASCESLITPHWRRLIELKRNVYRFLSSSPFPHYRCSVHPSVNQSVWYHSRSLVLSCADNVQESFCPEHCSLYWWFGKWCTAFNHTLMWIRESKHRYMPASWMHITCKLRLSNSQRRSTYRSMRIPRLDKHWCGRILRRRPRTAQTPSNTYPERQRQSRRRYQRRQSRPAFWIAYATFSRPVRSCPISRSWPPYDGDNALKSTCSSYFSFRI